MFQIIIGEFKMKIFLHLINAAFFAIVLFLANSNHAKANELPEDFPPLKITKSNNPSPEAIFMANRGTLYSNYIAILQNDGKPIAYKKVDRENWNFVVQPIGFLTTTQLVALDPGGWLDAYVSVMDDNLQHVRTYRAGNGMPAGGHEFIMMPNGHKIMLAFEPKHIDMSMIVEGGDPNALVRTSIIQEFDADDNIIFQWRAWDHIPLLENYAVLTGKYIYHTLFNSMDFDHEGNALISNRLNSEIIKIDRNSGEMLWRLGGKSNQFTFINEHEQNAPTYFSFQHDIRCLPNGNITLFDNGFQHSPSYSRAIEYKLNQVDKTAELVWEFRNDTDIFASANGSMRRLENGNSLIGWGWVASAYKKDLTEVTSNGEVALEFELPANVGSFRWVKSKWPLNQAKANVMMEELLRLNTYKFNTENNLTDVSLTFSQMNNTTPYNRIIVKKYEYGPKNARFMERAPYVPAYKFQIEQIGIISFSCNIKFGLDNLPWIVNPEKWLVYHRKSNDDGIFIPLETTYLSGSNELSITTDEFGEFIFGIPTNEQMPLSPTLFLPENENIINQNSSVVLKWSTHGYFQSCRIQISKDAQFDETVIDETLNPTLFTFENLEPTTKYYWRVKTMSEYGISDWSEIWTFIAAPEFITIKVPNGGETWFNDNKRKIIRWESNTGTPVKIELLRDGKVELLIEEAFMSHTGAYAWVIPLSVQNDSAYKIRVTSVADNKLIALSEQNFTIKDPAATIENDIAFNFLTVTNNPNPVENSTIFEIFTPESGNAQLIISDLFGQFNNIIFNDYLESGKHFLTFNTSSLPQGVYMYKLSIGSKSATGKMVVSK